MSIDFLLQQLKLEFTRLVCFVLPLCLIRMFVFAFLKLSVPIGLQLRLVLGRSFHQSTWQLFQQDYRSEAQL